MKKVILSLVCSITASLALQAMEPAHRGAYGTVPPATGVYGATGGEVRGTQMSKDFWTNWFES